MRTITLDSTLEKDKVIDVGNTPTKITITGQRYSRLRKLKLIGNVQALIGLPDGLIELELISTLNLELLNTLPSTLKTLIVDNYGVSISKLPRGLTTLMLAGKFNIKLLDNCTNLISITAKDQPLDILELPTSLESLTGSLTDCNIDLTQLPKLTTLCLRDYVGTVLDCSNTKLIDLQLYNCRLNKIINLPNTLTSLSLLSVVLTRDSLNLPESIRVVNIYSSTDSDGNVLPPPKWPKRMLYYNGSSLTSYK